MPLKDLLFLLIACLAWGFNFVASAAGLQHFSPFLFTLLRFVMVLLVLFPLLKLPPRGQWWRLLVVGLCIGALHFAANFWALRLSSDISSVAIALQAYVPMTVLLAVWLLKETIGWRTLVAIIIAFAGVLVIGLDPLVLQQLDALLMVLLSAFFLALGTTLMRGIRGVSAFSFQVWVALMALPLLGTLSWLTEADQWQQIVSADWTHWSAVLYSALISSIVGHGIYFYLIQKHPVTAVTPYLLLTPVFAVIFGILLWGDQPGSRLWLGGACVLLGVLIINLRARRKVPVISAPEA